MKHLRFLGLVGFTLLVGVGCASADEDPSDGDPLEASDEELIKKTGPTSHWSYNGLMPRLESPRLTVSLKGHTVHVEGTLPSSFHGRLPFHVIADAPGSRKVHLAYPIATVNTGLTEDGRQARNPEPFDYKVCGGDNFHATNSIGAFGGFPFIEYVCNHRDHDGRVRDGIAFHGPITSRTADGAEYWALMRGPVSHACNRMLGEHVLELAHLIGFDDGVRNTPVEVVAGFDTLHGKKIDVSYPASAGFTRPPADESVVFPIWQAVRQRADKSIAIDFPRWACETSRCASMPRNARDPYTGDPV